MTKWQWWVFLVILLLGFIAIAVAISNRTVDLNITVRDAYSVDPIDWKSHPWFNIYLREFQY